MLMKHLLIIANLLFIMTATTAQPGQYAQVNGIKMYYEIHGAGSPLVLLHGGGSTINTSFGRILPELAKTHKVIAIELQAHGHTGDRDAPETFAQDANDVVELLRQLHVERADILGFSNGGQTAIELGVKHPGSVRKLVIASAFYRRDDAPEAFWKGFDNPNFADMPQLYKDEYLRITHSPERLMNMFHKDVQRMKTFSGWSDEQIRSITAPALVVIGDRDIATPDRAAAMTRLLPHGHLLVLPGAHGQYLGEANFPDTGSTLPGHFVGIVNEFLTKDF
jgi:pimeloyl-ACP methyl ester carboxylesterase